jgi:hypothetical protein
VTALLHEAAERYARVWAIAFGALETCWTWAEMAQPSQQYADPLLPCVALAMFPASLTLSYSIPRLLREAWR